MKANRFEFRAWDRVNSVMSKPFRLVHDTELFSDMHIVMQSTGLKDKKGKEIFEGDILEYKDKGNITYSGRYEVEWDKEKACWGGDQMSNVFPDVAKEAKIIGNVYENPKLLEEEWDYDDEY